MNHRVFSSILLLGPLTASVSNLSAKAIPPSLANPMAYAVSSAGPYIERGSLRIWVLSKLGEPAQRLSPDVWIYRGYAPTTRGRRVDAGCSQLVVTFTDGVVTDLKLANGTAVELIAANLRARQSAAHVTSSD